MWLVTVCPLYRSGQTEPVQDMTNRICSGHMPTSYTKAVLGRVFRCHEADIACSWQLQSVIVWPFLCESFVRSAFTSWNGISILNSFHIHTYLVLTLDDDISTPEFSTSARQRQHLHSDIFHLHIIDRGPILNIFSRLRFHSSRPRIPQQFNKD